MMKFDDNSNIECLSWETARSSFQAVSPELCRIIDAWGPSPQHRLYRVTYRFGDHILKDGVFQLPDRQGQLCSLKHPAVPAQLLEDLDYRLLPLGMLIHNDSEVFLETDDRLIPLTMVMPGKFIGLWECLDPQVSFFPRRVWSICAGSRSLFMVPKISEMGAHTRLCKQVGVRCDPPRSIIRHQPVFVEIARCLRSPWRNEIIFFSKSWFTEQEEQPGWLHFHYYLLKQGWRQSEFYRNKVTFDRIWDLFTMQLGQDNAKASPYLIETLKQLMGIASNAYVGFRPTANNETLAPIALIQDAYIDHYQLKHYFPTIMGPSYFDLEFDTRPIYYSLQMPTCLGSHPKTKVKVSYMDELRILQLLVSDFITLAKSGALKIEGTLIERMVNNIRVDYFHSDKDIAGYVLNTELLPNADEDLVKFHKEYVSRVFATSGTFLRGLVRIMKQV